MALPVLTTLVGGVAAYLWLTRGAEFQILEGTLQQTTTGVLIVAGLGLCGGLAISLFGQVALHHVNMEDDPHEKAKRRASDGSVIVSKASIVYKKEDVKDNERSVTKTMTKYKEKADAELVERNQILEMGTEGLERKKREQLGLKSVNSVKSSTTKKSGGKK